MAVSTDKISKVGVAIPEILLATAVFFASPIWIHCIDNYASDLMRGSRILLFATVILVVIPSVLYLALLYFDADRRRAPSAERFRAWRIVVFSTYFAAFLIALTWLFFRVHRPWEGPGALAYILFWYLVPFQSVSVLTLSALSGKLVVSGKILDVRILLSILLFMMPPLDFIMFWEGT